MSEAEFAALKQAADEGSKAFAEIEKMKLAAEVDKLVFSASNAEGRILPKQKDALVTLMFSLNAKQRDQLRNIVSGLPKADRSIFKEIGSAGDSHGTATSIAEQVRAAAQEKVKASEGGKLKYSEAVSQVLKEKPELKAQYDEALAAGEIQ
jgi:hypothetical protein